MTKQVYYFYLFIRFKSVLGFDVVRDRIVAQTRGKFHRNMLRQYSAHIESFDDCPER